MQASPFAALFPTQLAAPAPSWERDVDVVVKQTSGVFSLVRPKVDAIYEDTALAGRQMGELLLRRIAGEAPETLQIVHQPEINF